ncbi:hypothetical protein ABL78_1805 [Leptomonas seymouri]|uniref:WW domain-containing protein n=1 Tax=Leptomonas seymouri TaxID=5684 RepID=A0A0N0P7Q8_LEPSE|nr:hypothetical protein ABL78_1805 [Leptomonas seymouri]|eukprot:KPI89069.1 hypothetical protein ABL78_1805 [Leptomonas seymouri]
MEYRCYIVGDAVTEPGALLRRLLYQPFPEAEERALKQQSLLFTRSEEAKGTNAYPMAVSLPSFQEARAASLTLPNPSMPSVDITVRFAAITDRCEFEQVMLRHYNFPSAGRGATRHPPHPSPSPISSCLDKVSSEGLSLPSSARSLALQAPPQAIVLTFNPFSMCSFSKLRVEWVSSLRVLRQQRQQLTFSAAQQQQHLKRTTSAVFNGSSAPASPLTPGYPVDSVESFPVVLLVATRMELMRDTMEATPPIHVPSLLEVTEVAQALQAQAYVEVGTSWDESIDVLRATIARACMGELANAPLVTYNAAYRARQTSVARAIEAVQADPYGEEDEEGGVDGGSIIASAPLTDAASSPAAMEGVSSSPSPRQSHGDGDAQREPEAPSKEEGCETEERQAPMKLRNMDEEQQVGQEDEKMQRTGKVADSTFDSNSASAPTACATAAPEERRERVTSELDAANAGARSADPVSFAERGEGAGEGERGNSERINMAEQPSGIAQESNPSEAPMSGRQLRRHLLTALAPLAVSDHKKPGVGCDGLQQGSAGLSPRPSPLNLAQATTAAAAAAAATSSTPVAEEGHETTPRHRKLRNASLSIATTQPSYSKWTCRRHPRTGRVFYVHRASRKSQYDCPGDYDGPPPPAATAASQVNADTPQHPQKELCERQPKCVEHLVEVAEEQADHFVLRDDPDKHTLGEAAPSALPGSRFGTGAGKLQEGVEVDKNRSLGSVEGQVTSGAMGSWCPRQQLQLRRTQAERLTHQVQQLRLQLERLRAQSEANAELKLKVATLRSELDDREQTFSARVAEQNQKLAKEVLDITVAVEELAALTATPPLLLSKGNGDATGTSNDSAEPHTVDHGLRGGEKAPLTGLARDIQQLEEDIKESMQGLQLALSRRDAELNALETLQHRRQFVAQRKREAEAEITTLLKRLVPVEEALLPLFDELTSVQDEARCLRDRVRDEEERHLAYERQRQRQLEAYVAERHSAEEQASKLDQLRLTRTRALEVHQESLRCLQLPSHIRPSEVLEENQRLRLGLESATGRAAEALLRSAEAVHLLALLARDVETTEKRIAARRVEERQRLVQAYDAAEMRRAEAVQKRYSSQVSNGTGYAVTAPRCSDDAQPSYPRTPTELLDKAVDAYAEAFEEWRLHDTRIATPLLESARRVVMGLQVLLRSIADALHSSDDHVNSLLRGDQHARGQPQPLCIERLQSEVAGIRRSAKERCREPLQALTQHIFALGKVLGVDASADAAGGAPASSAIVASGDRSTGPPHPPEVVCPPPAPYPIAQVESHEAALERGLWSTCDRLVARLPHLNESFIETYRSMRKPP